jgi:NADPH2 dehydrogenase
MDAARRSGRRFVSYPSPASFKSAAEFRERLQAFAPALDLVESVGDDCALGAALDLGSHRVGNRFVIHPMEGWDGTVDGAPTADTLRRWQRFGASGAKWIWGGEAFAVNAEGRANPNQLHWRDETSARAGLRALLSALKDEHRARHGRTEDLVVGLQLTHSGRFAKPEPDTPRPRIAQRHPILDARLGIHDDSCLLSDRELESIADDYVRAARTAEAVGFDFVDVKCCHGYLLHELLGARRRPGRYGGFFHQRAALVLRIVDDIAVACPNLRVGVRLSASDVVPYTKDDTGVGRPSALDGAYLHGFGVDEWDPTWPDLDEPARLIALLAARGVEWFNITLGSPYYCPHLQRPAAYPPSDGYLPPRDPLTFVAEHLSITRHLKRAFPHLVFVGTGYTYLQEWLAHVAEYEVRNEFVDAVGIGRMALSYPELPSDVLAGRSLDRKKLCRTFSDCTTAPRNALRSGCYPLDPYYRSMPEAAVLKSIKAKSRESKP